MIRLLPMVPLISISRRLPEHKEGLLHSMLTNNYSMTMNLPCGEGYSLWEDISNLPNGIVFKEINSNIGIVNGNNVLFNIDTQTSATISLVNEQECTGRIEVIKYIDGVIAIDGSFDFYIQTPTGAQRGPFTLDADNNYRMTFDLPCGRGYILWEDETSMEEGFVFKSIRSNIAGAAVDGNRITFAIGPNTNGTIGIMNETECTGEVIVTKYIDGALATEGAYTIKVSNGDWVREFDLDESNGWTKTMYLPCDVEYTLWEDEDSMEEGVVFKSIRTNMNDAVIDGNLITFTATAGPMGAIGIMNETECTGEVIVTKYIDGALATEGAYTIKVSNGDWVREFDLDESNGWTKTMYLPCDVEYTLWEDEDSMEEGVVFSKIRSNIVGRVIDGNLITFTATAGPMGAIGIMNETECTGEVIVTKYIDGALATEGAYTIKVSNGDWVREFDLDESNGWTKTMYLPCDVEYTLWEDEDSMEEGVVFKSIRTNMNDAVIDGNLITFTATAGPMGTIGILNESSASITIIKSGLLGADSATFTLFDSADVQIGSPIVLSNATPSDSWTSLGAGSYYVVETVPTGYSAPLWTIGPPIEISGSGVRIPGETDMIDLDINALNVTMIVSNVPVTTPSTGSITIVKDGLLGTDSATFTLFNSADVQIGSPIVLSNTTSSGTWSGLVFGSYYVVETIPAGYSAPLWTIGPPIGTSGSGERIPGAGTLSISTLSPSIAISVTNTIIEVETIIETRTERRVDPTIEVLGIQELPFTGNNLISMMIRAAIILACLGFVLYFLKGKKGFNITKK
jgi:protein associated with RNAse G/E